MRVKAIVFDVDGVLINTEDAYPRVVQTALARFAGVRVSKQRILTRAGMHSFQWFEPFVRGKPNAHVLARKLAKWGDGVYYRYYLPKYSKPMRGVKQTLHALKRRGLKLAIVTNQTRNEVQVTQKIIGFTGFDVVVTADDAPPKPNPTGFRKILRKLGIAPREALLVGDTAVDKRLAGSVGVPLVLIHWKRNARARELRGVPRLKRFSELLGLVGGLK
jgi:HAD superfamily hydrolase (TIGR01509 family)